MQKCCVFCFAKNKNKDAVQKCIFASHFVGAKMHLMRTFCVTKCYKCIFAYIFQRKMFSKTKCYKCILASNAFDAKMRFCVHFPKENVQHHILLCKMFSIKYIFVTQLCLMQKCCEQKIHFLFTAFLHSHHKKQRN